MFSSLDQFYKKGKIEERVGRVRGKEGGGRSERWR